MSTKKNMLTCREEIIQGLLQVEGVENNLERATDKNVKQEKQRKRGESSQRIGKNEGTARTSRKRCAECYRRIEQEKGSKEARSKTPKVLAFCEDCEKKPTMCLNCFRNVHD
nr:uncharacterized protein LOC111515874 [Leptinotarsa decemlineata]